LLGFLTAADFELGMLSMQSRLWEETKQYQIASRSVLNECELESVEIANLHGYGQSWPVLLEIWRVTMVQFRPSSHGYFSVPSEQSAHLTGMLLYDVSMLCAYAKISFLRRLANGLHNNHYNKGGKGQQLLLFLHQHEMRVQQWTRSNNIARDALWHASQVLHLVFQQTSHPSAEDILFNLVIYECLFPAMLIAWAFCRSRFACFLCAPLSSMVVGNCAASS
jgi:hypothetical protein